MQVVLIYTDGAARGNPGPSASGYKIYNSEREMMVEAESYNGIQTNNFAEYNAVVLALEWCKANLYSPEDAEINVNSDSEIVVRQLNGRYRVRSGSLLKMNTRVRELVRTFGAVRFANVPRENPEIVKVDAALNVLLDDIAESNNNLKK